MADYYNVTTNLGDAEIAAAIASNTKLAITHIAFGDGNGSVPTPQKTRTTLVREVHRQAVTKYERHPTNANWIIIETIIPSHIGGFWVREMGVIANGKLISNGSHAPFEKVADSTGVSEYRLKFTLNVRDGNVVNITLDQSLIYASQAWVDENYIKRANIRKNFGSTYASVMSAGYDFNTILPGDYVFHDASISTLNRPPFEYASVYCEGTLSNSEQCFAIARDYFTGQIATRARQNGNWSGWNIHALSTDNVASATRLKTARNITLLGDGTGNTNFDGTSNTAINFTLNNVNNSAGVWGANNLEIPTFTLNKKGLLTSATNRQFPIASTTQYGATVLYAGLDLNSNEHAATAATVKYLSDNKVDKTAIRKTFGNTYAPIVGAGYDFNNIMPGDYVFHDASQGTLNAPPFAYASVFCEGTLSNSDQRIVIAREYFSGQIATKARQNNDWSDWNVHALKTDNVASATKLQTARTIAISGAVTGTATGFDGSANIAIATTAINGSQISTGTIPAARIPTLNQSTTGNAATATKLQTARKINGVDFDGSTDIDLPLIGVNQTWQNLTASRAAETIYTNTTGKPIQVAINYNGNNAYFDIGGVEIYMPDYNAFGFAFFIIPNGTTYRIRNQVGINSWSELR